MHPNVRGLPQAAAENHTQDESLTPSTSSVHGDDSGLRQPLVGGSASLFSKSEITDRFQLVKSGKMSRDEFLSTYPENMVMFVDGRDGRFSVAVDESILRDATDAKSSEL